ncbi:fumarylacetoacetate hydrolase family protein [Streptomyces mirabilis]|uniref:fumarylacetoacetate hydrolase family protein n=1 Tax=Streptomyces mirabilis TaxID=68239 RepID=UPI0036ACC23E
MKIANRYGRVGLVDGQRILDVERASRGEFGPTPAQVYEQWPAFRAWARTQDPAQGDPYTLEELGAPSPTARQVFGLGTNYRKHAEEVGWAIPEVPLVFTKFPSSVAGPFGAIELSGPRVDWEVEVVIVIGEGGRSIPASQAWNHIAGITAGQDISDRDVQLRPKDNPQHSLGKSFPGYASIGPVLVTPDEYADPDDIALTCSLNAEQVQNSSTADLVFPVPQLIEYLSSIVTLLPGDLIFTGTPSGVGTVMDPPRFLTPDDEVVSWVAGVGTMRHTFTDRADVAS